MRTGTIKLFFATIAIVSVCVIGAAHAGLNGTEITDQEIFPTIDSPPLQTFGPSTVPITFNNVRGLVFDLSISDNTISYAFLESGFFTPFAFNGSKFIDSPLSFAAATIDPSTTVPGVSDAELTISSGDLYFNLSAVSFETGQKIIVDVSTVPEPSTWTMMLLGFVGLGYAAYRKAKSGTNHATLDA